MCVSKGRRRANTTRTKIDTYTYEISIWRSIAGDAMGAVRLEDEESERARAPKHMYIYVYAYVCVSECVAHSEDTHRTYIKADLPSNAVGELEVFEFSA